MGELINARSRFEMGSYTVEDTRRNAVVTPSEATNLKEIYLASSQWTDVFGSIPYGYPGYTLSNDFTGDLLPEIAHKHELVSGFLWVTGSWLKLTMAVDYVNTSFDLSAMPQRLQDPDNNVPSMGGAAEVITKVSLMDEFTAGVMPDHPVVGRFNFTRSKGLYAAPTASAGWPPPPPGP